LKWRVWSAVPSWLSSGKTTIAAYALPVLPPVVPVVGEVTKSSPPGANRSWRASGTVANSCAQKPFGNFNQEKFAPAPPSVT